MTAHASRPGESQLDLREAFEELLLEPLRHCRVQEVSERNHGP